MKKTRNIRTKAGANFCGLCTIHGLILLLTMLLLSSTGSRADQKTTDAVTLTLPDASVYTGGIKNGLFHGHGMRLHPDGSKYDGEYVDGLANGAGVLTTRTGDSYVGQFKHNLYNGTGLFMRVNHDRYEGEFKDGVFEGTGVIAFGDGANAKGQFKAWVLNGTGTYVYASGTKAAGEFKNGALNGQGLVVTPSGRRYQGLFKNGKFAGGDKPDYGEWRSKSWLGGWDPVFDTVTAGKPSFWLPVLLVISLLFNLIQALSGRSKNWFQPQLAEKRPPDYSGIVKNTERFEKIAVLENEVQAEALDALLAERGIPHEMKSYHDSALDGVYQSSGWGHVAAPQAHAAAVLQALKDLSSPPGADAPA